MSLWIGQTLRHFLNLSTTDISGQIILCCGAVLGSVFSSIPCLHPLNASSTLLPQLWQPGIAKCPLGAKSAPAENHCSKGYRGLQQRSLNAGCGAEKKFHGGGNIWTGPWRIDTIPIGQDERIKEGMPEREENEKARWWESTAGKRSSLARAEACCW